MTKSVSQSHGASMAVYSRNHRGHLESAAAVGSTDSQRLVTLRSQKEWVSADKATRKYGPTAIYFAVVDGGPFVEYEAELVEVQLNPDAENPETKRLLAYAAETTSHEGLWGDKVKTLYAIRNCRKLSQHYRLSELTKCDGGQPLSDDYIRGYALVRRRVAV